MTQEETSKLKFEEIKKAFKECNYYEPHFYRDAFDFYLLYDKISEVGVRVYFLTEGLFIDTTDNFYPYDSVFVVKNNKAYYSKSSYNILVVNEGYTKEDLSEAMNLENMTIISNTINAEKYNNVVAYNFDLDRSYLKILKDRYSDWDTNNNSRGPIWSI